MQNMNNEYSPRLRFPSFIHSWHKHSFDNIFIFKTTSTNPRSDLSTNGYIYYIHYGDIHTKCNNFIDFNKADISFLKDNISAKSDFIVDGDLIIADTSEDYPGIGKTVEVCNLSHKKAISGLHTFLLRPYKNIFCPFFGSYLFSSACIKSQLIKIATGMKVYSISKNTLKTIILPIPNIEEQQKIADCLSSLDELIEAHEQKLDTLKQHKKGLMQRLFPADGETTPRWRFPEFKNAIEWRKKSLGAICHLQAGKFIDSAKIFPIWNKGLFPCYGGNGLRGYVEKSNYKTCYPIIGRQGALCGNVKMPTGEFYATEHAIVAECNNDSISNIFLFYLLSKLNINRLAIGQAQPGISIEIVKKISIKLPDIHEQQKIADCLTSIDEQIEAQEEKIKALKEHKKGMIQQLFPSL